MNNEINNVNVEEKIEKLVSTFFEKLGFILDDINISDKGNNIFLVKIKSKDSQLLIWSQWKTLNSIRKLLSLMLNVDNNFIFLQLEVNDYLEKKQSNFFRHIDMKVDLVKRTWREYIFDKLSSYERKKIHAYIASLWTNVYSKSVWEWEKRKLHLLKRSDKLTIDFDWDNI